MAREDEESAADRVKATLAQAPELLAVFEAIQQCITARHDVALLLSGSLAKGNVTDLSDLDLELVVKPGTDPGEVRAWIRERVFGLGKPLAHFPASHLGLPDLEIFFLERNHRVIKVDIWTLVTASLPMISQAKILHDPGGFVETERAKHALSSPGQGPDFSDLHHKFVGWMWFTFSKIQRNQQFEAVESINAMRGYALLPFLHLLAGTPAEGYRLLEERLPRTWQAAFLATYPRSLEGGEVKRGLWALIELFQAIQPEISERLGSSLKRADLDGMIQLIRQYDGVAGG